MNERVVFVIASCFFTCLVFIYILEYTVFRQFIRFDSHALAQVRRLRTVLRQCKCGLASQINANGAPELAEGDEVPISPNSPPPAPESTAACACCVIS